MCTHFTPITRNCQLTSTIKPSSVFHVLQRLVKELVHGRQKRFGHSDNIGLLAVWTATKRFRPAGLYLFRMLRIFFGNGQCCYKRGYDAVKLAGARLLRAGVAKVARVALIAVVVRNAQNRHRYFQTALDMLVSQKATRMIKPFPGQ